MTKKMFQVTRAGMVAVTIFICLNLLLDKKVMVGDGHIWERFRLEMNTKLIKKSSENGFVMKELLSYVLKTIAGMISAVGELLRMQ